MSDLSSREKRKLECLFEMSGGYVLDLSNRSFAEFVDEHTGRDIDDRRYAQRGTGSKAWRLRVFWKVEPNHLVGKLIVALIDYRVEVVERQALDPDTWGGLTRLPDEERLVEECRRIAARLTQGSAVHDADALQAPVDEPDFEAVAQQVRDAIQKNQPEAGLDRLHTFVMKFVRSLCTTRGVEVTRDKPLHSLFGEYVKALRAGGHLESRMTERILKSSISTLEAFNDVRNGQSLAHDNPLLNFDESLLILSHVASTVRFLKSLEDRLGKKSGPAPTEPGDDIPF